MKKTAINIGLGTVFVVSVFFAANSVNAGHSWADYHWANSAGAVELNLIDNCTADWDGNLATSRSDWNSTHLALTVVPGSEVARDRKRCKAVDGQIKVCNASYGLNGWLGLASINIDTNNHITNGTAKLNDSYSSYWTPEEKNHVMCQEIGHLFGLGHTSEDGSSQGTCMDYSQDVGSQHPNAHDFSQLDTIYGHLDSYDTAIGGGGGGGGGGSGCNSPPGKGCNKSGLNNGTWGLMVHGNTHEEVYVQRHRDGSSTVRHVRLAN